MIVVYIYIQIDDLPIEHGDFPVRYVKKTKG